MSDQPSITSQQESSAQTTAAITVTTMARVMKGRVNGSTR